MKCPVIAPIEGCKREEDDIEAKEETLFNLIRFFDANAITVAVHRCVGGLY